MRITRLRLTDFKVHGSLIIEPAARLTVIRGPNESGKSTLGQAIELALFGESVLGGEDGRDEWAWGASSPPEVVLEFEADGQAGRLVRRLTASSVEAELALDGHTSTDPRLIEEQVAQLTGIPSRGFWRATASVGHRELDALDGDEPLLQERLQQVVSGADRGTARAKRMLQSAIERDRGDGQAVAGQIQRVGEEIELLERELTLGQDALDRLLADRSAAARARRRREELELQLRRQQAELAQTERAERLARQRDDAAERLALLERAVELTEEAERSQRAMPSGITLPQLRAAVTRASGLRYEISELEAEVSVAAEATATDERPEMAPPRPMRWLVLAAVLVALGWIASFLLSDAGLVGGAVMAALAAGVVVTLVAAVRGAGRRRQYGLAMQLAQAAITQHGEDERSQQERLRRSQRELASTLAAVGVDDVEAAEALLDSMQERTEALAHIEGELRGLGIEDRNLRRLREAREQAAVAAEQANQAAFAMGSPSDDPAAAHADAERLVAQTLVERDEARSAEDLAQARVDANQVDAELLAGLAERLALARERSAELEGHTLVYEGTLRAIEAAERATLKTAARYLEEHMGPAIAAITDGRYDAIEVDERDLAFRVRVPETGELVDVERLSRGTVDQVYLGARLGLLRLVSLDRRPPLILDDPFVSFDDARAERALRLVKRLATDHGLQVLYLTCSDRFDTLADELVVLPAPSSERLLAHPPRPVPDVVTGASEPAGAPVPTLRFEPDPRPNPDPAAPRRNVRPAPAPDPDTGIVDPFGLGRSGGNEVPG